MSLHDLTAWVRVKEAAILSLHPATHVKEVTDMLSACNHEQKQLTQNNAEFPKHISITQELLLSDGQLLNNLP